ncbi:MAG: Fic family protein, partial [Candidatus Marinimicrobia bacterium]|nr:Fic family protein [Candidatus Neomarinimicrobiota bacterium]
MDKDLNFRSGRYMQQLGDYKAFIPNSLPLIPPLNIDPEMLVILSQADQAIGRLDSAVDRLPNPDLFVMMYVRKEAVLSSQIEGTQASLDDLLEYEASVRKRGLASEVEEISNYVVAMNYGLAALKELPLSLRIIKEVHARLLSGVRGEDKRPGEFRNSQNLIGPTGATLKEATFVPPPPNEVMSVMGDLEEFWHSAAPLPVLIKCGLVHSQFETIHPFLDGNGRIGRLLITLMLCWGEVLSKPLLYISHYFKQHRSEYEDRLQMVRDNDEWEEWIKFFLEAVRSVAGEAAETASKIIALREEHRELVGGKLRSSPRALMLLDQLFEHFYVSVNIIKQILNCSYSTANNIVSEFTELGLLVERTGRSRNRSFAYQPYLNL